MLTGDSLVDQCNSWICETLRRTGARLDMGMRLHQTYREAGLWEPQQWWHI